MPTSSAISRTVVAATPLRANSPAATARIWSCLSAGSRLMSFTVLWASPGNRCAGQIALASRLSIVRPNVSNKRLLRGAQGSTRAERAGQDRAKEAAVRQKLMTAAEVVAELHPGMTIGIGGLGSPRQPLSLGRAMCRADLADLTILRYGGPDPRPL